MNADQPAQTDLGLNFPLLVNLSFVQGPLCNRINPLPGDKILDWSKLKLSVDDNFKFDENIRKFSKRVENTG